MIGLDYLLAGYVHLAAGNIQCNLKKTPQIHVAASDTSVVYDHSKTQAQLDRFENDTVSPYGTNVQTHVGGLMAGEVSVSQNIRIMQESYQHLNAGCLYIDNLSIKIHIKPVIYIAKDYPKSSCMYKEIMVHEKKHIAVDRQIVNKYTNLIVKGVNDAMKKIGYAHGPFPLGRLQQEQKNIQDYAQSVLKQYSDQMSAERRKSQQDVDSLHEYERVQAACRGKK